jgi:hypothetical protein
VNQQFALHYQCKFAKEARYLVATTRNRRIGNSVALKKSWTEKLAAHRS